MTDILIDKPIYPYQFDFIDPDCKFIAEYLYKEVNETFYSSLRSNIIKTYRTWNDIAIPLTDFPVLKVYTTDEEISENDPYTSTGFNIVYALAFTSKPKVGDVSRFVTREIIRNLVNASILDVTDEGQVLFQVDWSKQIRVDYETLVSPENTIYRYATISCSLFTRLDVL